MHQIDPNLNRSGWSKEDNQKLFKLQKSLKSHWKKISENFIGRTDNSIKNQFFSVVRKALRKICKVLGKATNTIVVSRIKPKVLSEFLTMDLELKVNGRRQPVKVNVSSFVQKFSFTKYQVLAIELNDSELEIIQKCMDRLNLINDNYMKRKIRKREIEIQFPLKEEDNNVVRKEALYNTKDHFAPLQPKQRMSNETIFEIKQNFENLFKSNINVSTVPSEREKSKVELIGFFDSLCNLSQRLKGVLQNTHSNELDESEISNIFSITNKTKKFFNGEKEPNNNKLNVGMNKVFNNGFEIGKKKMSPYKSVLNNSNNGFLNAPVQLTHQMNKSERRKPSNNNIPDPFSKYFANDNFPGEEEDCFQSNNKIFGSRILNESGKSGFEPIVNKNPLSVLNKSAESNFRFNLKSTFSGSRVNNNSDEEMQDHIN